MPENLEKDIELQNQEVNEILSATPKWILRWGISLIFLFIITFITLSYFIKYPDILKANITITTLHPPVLLVSKVDGKIVKLLVKNNQHVKTGQIIAVIENNSNYEHVLKAYDQMTLLFDKLKIVDTCPQLKIQDSLIVGELTPSYLNVIKSIKEYNLFHNVNPYERQITLLKKDLVNYGDLLAKYQNQISLSKEQLKLVESDYNRDKSLFENKVISAREYDNKKKEYLNALSNYETIKIMLSNALIQVNSIEKNILQQQILDFQEKNKLKNDLQQSLKSSISEFNKWKSTYLISSPVDGKISFSHVWSINQNVQIGNQLFSVIPFQKQKFIGKCILPIHNSGKLKIGQKVNIKLENYPFYEHGMLHGIVSNISEVPEKDNYFIDVDLPVGLKTSYNKTIMFKEQMSGTAEIITINTSIMDRILYNFRKLMDPNGNKEISSQNKS